MREICKSCDKPIVTCICKFLPGVKCSLQPNQKCSILVLQYPKESKHKYGSVQLLKHVIKEGAEVVQCKKILDVEASYPFYHNFDSLARQSVPQDYDGSVQPVLIFPAKFDTPILKYEDQGIFYVYILIDATWDTARRMLLSSSPLRNLPVYKLDTSVLGLLRGHRQGSAYHKVRKEIDGGMSTLEAIVCCLQAVPQYSGQAKTLLQVSDLVTEQWSSFKP